MPSVFDRSEKITETGCWIWTGAFKSNGYGHFGGKAGYFMAHRAAWEEVNGPIPTGMLVCHRCDVRSCINPAHLFLGTHTDNMRDASAKGRVPGWNALKTHCKRGHEFSEENTYRMSSGERRCATCRRIKYQNLKQTGT